MLCNEFDGIAPTLHIYVKENICIHQKLIAHFFQLNFQKLVSETLKGFATVAFGKQFNKVWSFGSDTMRLTDLQEQHFSEHRNLIVHNHRGMFAAGMAYLSEFLDD